jgi:serine/threonine-protein kinase
MAIEDPYAAPTAPVSEQDVEVPDDVLKKIKHGWVAALFVAGVILVITLVVMSGTEIIGFSAWKLFDVALILGLAFGIYKKSRVCAVLMLVYFIAFKILIMAETGRPSGIPMALVIAYFFWQGVSGTFAYHKFKKQKFALTTGRG